MAGRTTAQRGIAGAAAIGIAAIVIAVALAARLASRGRTGAGAVDEAELAGELSAIEEMVSGGSAPVEPAAGGERRAYAGQVLAGDASPLLEFNTADYERARARDVLVVLYFYANWCPICAREFPQMAGAFDKIEGADAVGFRVSYNDDEVDEAERALARELGVTYQHTKVFLRGSSRVLTSLESWDTDRYLAEIEAALESG